jgi:alpha/beta superfamily hydrolase
MRRIAVYTESQRITFTANGVTCEGLLTRPEADSRAPGIVICHPHPLRGGDMLNNVVRALAESFAAGGFATLRFNFRGVGRSTGQYGEGIGEQEDAQAALAWLRAQPGIDADRLVLAGYSFGARVTLAVASADARVRGFIVVAPPMLRGAWPSLESTRGPKIFLCGDRDSYVPLDTLTDVVKNVPEPKYLVVLPDADHFFVGQERILAQHAVKLLQSCFKAGPTEDPRQRFLPS